MEIRGQRQESLIILKPLIVDYIESYLAMFSSQVRELLRVSSLDSERDYLVHRLQQPDEFRSFFQCIFDVSSNQLIGAIEIRNSLAHAGQLYCWIHEQFWGKGHFYQAMLLASQDYFKATFERSFSAHVDIDNPRSFHALQKCGFKLIGFYDGPQGLQYRLVYKQ